MFNPYTNVAIISNLKMFLILGIEHQSINFDIHYQSPFNNDTRCNYYGKDGNAGPDYDCNQIGREVVVRRWDYSTFSLCNINVYGGKILCYSHTFLFIDINT